MIYLALAEAFVLVAVVSVFAGLLRSSDRAHARREDLLLNQLLHAVDKPWTPAPADEFVPPTPLYDDDGELMVGSRYSRFTPSPEQEP